MRKYIFTLSTIVIMTICSIFARENDLLQILQHKNSILDVNADDGDKIEEIITTLSKTSLIGLAFKKSHLNRLGADIKNNVSTFGFLAYIFSRTKLINNMRSISRSSIKYNNFIFGLKDGLEKECKNEWFLQHVNDFSELLNIDKRKTEDILLICMKKVENGDKLAFKPFLNYLINSKNLKASL